MTNQKEILICYNSSYMGAAKISHKARCSMAPRNCPYEVSQVITLLNGMKKTIYYCLFFPEKKQQRMKEKEHKEPKTSCRLDGG